MSQSQQLQYLDSLESFVCEELKCVSFRWLSRKLNVTADAAKKMLFAFAEKKKDEVKVIYCLSGILPNGIHSIKLSTKEKLEESKKKFDKLLSYHIYSIQTCYPKDPTQLWSQEFDQYHEFLKSGKFEDYISPRYGNVQPADGGKRVGRNRDVKFEKMEIEIDKKAKGVESVSVKSKPDSAPPKSKKTPETTAGNKSAPKGKMDSFFKPSVPTSTPPPAAAPTPLISVRTEHIKEENSGVTLKVSKTTKKEAEEETKSNKNIPTTATNVTPSKKNRKVILDEDEEETSQTASGSQMETDSSPIKYSQTKTNSVTKRKRIVESDEDEPVQLKVKEERKPSPQKEPQLKKVKAAPKDEIDEIEEELKQSKSKNIVPTPKGDADIPKKTSNGKTAFKVSSPPPKAKKTTIVLSDSEEERRSDESEKENRTDEEPVASLDKSEKKPKKKKKKSGTDSDTTSSSEAETTSAVAGKKKSSSRKKKLPVQSNTLDKTAIVLPAATGTTAKRTKRVLVTKQRITEKGYSVVEDVWEEVELTAAEIAEEERKQKQRSEAKLKSAAAAASHTTKSTTKNAVNTNSKQLNIASYFGVKK